MEVSHRDPDPHQTRPDEPELDLYTIPSHSGWFVWDEIHEIERISLKEFFDGSSVSRTPKIYKEYRDFIINKYREEPSGRLTFTEVRKSLVGDVNLLRKVFLFLENWGLINFSASSDGGDGEGGGEEERSKVRVRVEEGVPNGLRVVATPNSTKPIPPPATVGKKGDAVDSGLKLPPLSSYSDVFADLMKQKDVVCGNCGDGCNSGHYKHTKGDNFLICEKCFKNGNYGEKKSVDDFKLNGNIQDNGKHGAVWTEAETLLLLESVLKYGDDWELVAQNVPTKTKFDCIAKLIELPFGEVLGSATHTKGNSNDPIGSTNSLTQPQLLSSGNQETVKTGDQCDEKTNEGEQNGDAVENGPPLKRQCIASLWSPGGSLMEQVARISSMVSRHIAAAAAEAAITSLCDANSYPREIFYGDDDDCVTNGLPTSIPDSETQSVLEVEGSEMKEGPTQSENQDSTKDNIPLALRIRTAVATALGAAAARAKLLADQEEREIEHLMATIIETEMKKLHCKIKHFEDLEMIMKKQHAEMVEIEDFLLEERINVLQTVIKAGIPRWKNHPSIKS